LEHRRNATETSHIVTYRDRYYNKKKDAEFYLHRCIDIAFLLQNEAPQ